MRTNLYCDFDTGRFSLFFKTRWSRTDRIRRRQPREQKSNNAAYVHSHIGRRNNNHRQILGCLGSV